MYHEMHLLDDILNKPSIIYVYLCVLCAALPLVPSLICIETNPTGREEPIIINPSYMSFKVYVTITSAKG